MKAESAASAQTESVQQMFNPDSLVVNTIGGLRANLLMRGFGIMLCIAALGQLGRRPPANFLATHPISAITLGICGCFLALGGMRLITLVVAAAAGWLFIYGVLGGNLGRGLAMQAAEYPLFPVVPTVCVVIIAVVYLLEKPTGNAEAFQCRIDSLVVKAFRWIGLTTLFWVSFHKFNWDFLSNWEGSCEEALKPSLLKNWAGGSLPWLLSLSRPWLIVLMEGPVCIVLLIFSPRIGIIFVCLLFTIVSLLNALVVTLAVMVPALAFLPAVDVPVVRRYQSLFILLWVMGTSVALAVSCYYYQGTRLWYLSALHQATVMAILVIAGGCQVSAWFACRNCDLGLSRRVVKALGPRTRLLDEWPPGKRLLLLFATVCMLNGLCPYLGIKFEYSFAMLSNLRVDDTRWNHVIMPRWLRLTSHDPFVHLQRIQIDQTGGPNTIVKNDEELHPALYSPWVVSERLERMTKRVPQTSIYLELDYRGKHFEFVGSLVDEELHSFLTKLPPKDRWFQDELAISGPQRCVH